MNKSYPFGQIEKLLASAQNILVLLPTSPNFDQVASALSLCLALGKNGKQASVLAAQEMTVEFSHLVGVEKVSDKMPAGELVITVDAPIENIEKVTSGDEDGKLHLTIRPKAGVSPVRKEDLLFSSSSAGADLLFLIEPRRLESLGKIYQENENLLKEKPQVVISHFPKVEPQGIARIIDPVASSCSEITVSIIEGLNLTVDEDIGNNLLLGLRQATQNFQRGVRAETFEAAAFCLRHGAGNNQSVSSAPVEPESQPAPSPDWFEPKIYKGSTMA